jgi:mannose-6-phosphate isomerase-like protein (cupin superfamily)
MTPSVRPLEEFRRTPTACLFTGADDGLDASFFVTNHPPGEGVGQHVHPYPEVFIVQEGQATFMVDGEEVVVEAGNVVVVPRETAHGFENRGDGALRLVSVHPSGTPRQTWL